MGVFKKKKIKKKYELLKKSYSNKHVKFENDICVLHEPLNPSQKTFKKINELKNIQNVRFWRNTIYFRAEIGHFKLFNFQNNRRY